MRTFHKLLLALILAVTPMMLATNTSAQGISISIGDRPYYNRGPSYFDGGSEYYWVGGHRLRNGRWSRGRYVRRTTPLRRLHREHIRLHRAIFGG
ncbi:MAG: hypothetical protein ABI946_09690 [Chthoniobacterales bacterium]